MSEKGIELNKSLTNKEIPDQAHEFMIKKIQIQIIIHFLEGKIHIKKNCF